MKDYRAVQCLNITMHSPCISQPICIIYVISLIERSHDNSNIHAHEILPQCG